MPTFRSRNPKRARRSASSSRRVFHAAFAALTSSAESSLAISTCTAVLASPLAVRFASTRVPSEASNRTDFGGDALRWVSSRSPSHPACASGSASCSKASPMEADTVLEALALNVPSGR